MMKKMPAILVVALSAALSLSAVAQERPQRSSLMNRPRPNRSARQQQPASAAAAAPSAVPTSGEAPAFNWDQAPVELVLQAYCERLNKTILIDPQTPKATITLKSREGQKLTQDEYLDAIQTVLEMNGIHLEPYKDSFIRALPRKDVRKEGIPLIMDAEQNLSESGRVVSMMIPFKNISAEEAQKTLEGLKSNSGVLLVFERTNSILVTDTEQNINRMLEVIRVVDVAIPVTENVYVRQVKFASAQEIQAALQKIVEDSQKELEKSGGKQVNTPAPQPPRQFGRGLLRGKEPAPAAPVNNESLVMSVSDADRGTIRGKVLILADERSNKLIIVTSKANMDFFDRVIEALDEETTPDTVVKVYRLKYAEAEDVSDMINDLIGNAPSSKGNSKGSQNQNSKNTANRGGNLTRNQPAAQPKSANQRTGEAKAGELSKENTTVLADKRINGIVVMTQKELVPVIESIIESMDIKLSQVLIETCIIEVSLDDGLSTGVDWVRNGRQKSMKQATDAFGNNLYYGKQTTTTKTYRDGNLVSSSTSSSPLGGLFKGDYAETSTSRNTWDDADNYVETTVSKVADTAEGAIVPMVSTLVKNTFANGSEAYSSMLGGGGGSSTAKDALGNLVGADRVANPIGGGLNYFFTSDALNLSAVIQASKTDARTKYIASPIIMTLDNKEAVINATKMRYLLKGFTSSGNSYSTIAVPDYEQKELGIEIKVTPKINPNGTVMLTMEEKYSQVSGNQDIKYATGNTAQSSSDDPILGGGGKSSSALETVNVDTTATREMSSDVLLENGQTVIFGGLTETLTTESETGIPILKDIPIIGKWLFGSVEQHESRSELLVFMTPYVLDDSEAAQAEAIRRKNSMSDPRPWDDHGWSASNLADPVAKREQIRRLKDEAKRQDEERKTKIAIEKWKIDRAKELQKMSEKERNLWLEMHKEDLEDEKKSEELKELKEKMLDEKSQAELRVLADKIRREKLNAAEKELKAGEAKVRADNERARLDAEKAAERNESK